MGWEVGGGADFGINRGNGNGNWEGAGCFGRKVVRRCLRVRLHMVQVQGLLVVCDVGF